MVKLSFLTKVSKENRLRNYKLDQSCTGQKLFVLFQFNFYFILILDLFVALIRLHEVAALTNKVGLEASDVKPRSVMAHVALLGIRIDDTGAILQVNSTQNEHLCLLFSVFDIQDGFVRYYLKVYEVYLSWMQLK